jgi:hypothetical protein
MGIWAMVGAASREDALTFRAGNIHVNICAKAFEPRIEEVIEPWIYEWTCSSPYSRALLR